MKTFRRLIIGLAVAAALTVGVLATAMHSGGAIVAGCPGGCAHAVNVAMAIPPGSPVEL